MKKIIFFFPQSIAIYEDLIEIIKIQGEIATQINNLDNLLPLHLT